ncbi:UNKNOWN [Stylonychia lemnae]|uniref:Transmembrane protein n=1 Tax=Stylonychia lemnae TaxID=5949 RepID=A0A077ZV97_STYLE|nr:UNKNOWN [Stylonychia lemnae]|eukprot:CDW73230.1 UNKNOWN [Stylonychia lemnae]
MFIYTYNWIGLYLYYNDLYYPTDTQEYVDQIFDMLGIAASNALIVYFCFEMRVVYLKFESTSLNLTEIILWDNQELKTEQLPSRKFKAIVIWVLFLFLYQLTEIFIKVIMRNIISDEFLLWRDDVYTTIILLFYNVEEFLIGITMLYLFYHQSKLNLRTRSGTSASMFDEREEDSQNIIDLLNVSRNATVMFGNQNDKQNINHKDTKQIQQNLQYPINLSNNPQGIYSVQTSQQRTKLVALPQSPDSDDEYENSISLLSDFQKFLNSQLSGRSIKVSSKRQLQKQQSQIN